MSTYLTRYAQGSQLIDTPPPSDLGLLVVIPAYFEPDLIKTLQSLADCISIDGSVEVIVVINYSSEEPVDVVAYSQQCLQQCTHWADGQDSGINYHFSLQELPAKHAGVGLARKIGMDEAVRRFEQLNREGIIVCLDADCEVAPNYLQTIDKHFKANPNTPGCSIYYEHQLNKISGRQRNAIAGYELHLRYYVHGLTYGGLPAAFQTVGSAMAVRSSAYQKQGGMNKRKAGEDFYFLQKIIKLGGFTNLTDTTVYPSARISQRVPFGTGRAMRESSNKSEDEYMTYHLQTFIDLKAFIVPLSKLYGASANEVAAVWNKFTPALQGFITRENYLEQVMELNGKTGTRKAFEKRFFQWIDGFFAFKFANHARKFYQPVKVSEAATWLLKSVYKMEAAERLEDLLLQYRGLDRI